MSRALAEKYIEEEISNLKDVVKVIDKQIKGKCNKEAALGVVREEVMKKILELEEESVEDK